MKMNQRTTTSIMGAFIVLMQGMTAGAQVDQTVPSMNPSKNCRVKGASHIDGIRDYNFLNSDDCQTIFVRPELVGQQLIDYRISSNLDLCEAVNLSEQQVVEIRRGITDEHAHIRRLQKIETTNPTKIKKIQAEIERRIGYINWLEEQEEKTLNDKDKNYGEIPGATFSISVDARILPDDLYEIRQNNPYEFIFEGPNGKPEIGYKFPDVREANIVDSYYTFFYRKSSEREKWQSVLSSNSPLELAKESQRTGIVHVLANEGMQLQAVLNLPSICLGAYLDEEMNWQLKNDSQKPIFTISRQYTVHQRAAYGYSVALKNNAVVDRIMNHLATNDNSGFTLDDLFLNEIKHDMNEYLDFTWTSQMGSDALQFSPQKVKELKIDLFATYIQNYMDSLLANGVLEIMDSRPVNKVADGMAFSANGDTECFSSPLDKMCYQSVYRLTNWKGLTPDQLRASLTVNQSFAKTVGVNHMEPFTYNSYFLPQSETKE